ncbi:pyruvate kinase [Bacillus sp. JJ1773]|uniref:pyruvate kinase n=1 Tax=Bacillus sp. JJ1773 TaxID=3122965 RepID=UPI002FFFEEC1
MIRDVIKENQNLLNNILSSLHKNIMIVGQQEMNENSTVFLSKENLKAFLKLRDIYSEKLDFTLLQEGLSSFSTIHPHIHYSIEKMLNNLEFIDQSSTYDLCPHMSNQIKQDRNKGLFGRTETSVMVTLHSSMLQNQKIIKDLLHHGMNIARINCAHDSPEIWKKLVDCVREAELELGQERNLCKIHMELAGPKIRVEKIFYPEKPSNEERPYFNVKPGDMITIIRDELALELFAMEAKVFSINSPKALLNVSLKDKVFFNDGKIIGEVCSITDELIGITILKTNKKITKLREEEGLNLPDSFVHFIMPSMTNTDIGNLPFVHGLADSIGLSFVHHPRDLEKLRMLLHSLPPKNIGIIAKIETKEAFHNLSKIIIEGLNFDSFGIMIARGDLAVELGFTKLASIQEEIINLCQAAHIPIIWATGVLEQLTKKGMPSRAELTDAFMGLRADCIMLNKGEYAVDALKTLYELMIMKHTSETNRRKETFIQNQ